MTDNPWLTDKGIMKRYHFRDPKTVRIMRKKYGMPAHPRPGRGSGKRSRFLYYIPEIDAWMLERETPLENARRKAREIVETPNRRRK